MFVLAGVQRLFGSIEQAAVALQQAANSTTFTAVESASNMDTFGAIFAHVMITTAGCPADDGTDGRTCVHDIQQHDQQRALAQKLLHTLQQAAAHDWVSCLPYLAKKA